MGSKPPFLKRDNSDSDVASELQPRCRGWICGARAGVGLCKEAVITPDCRNGRLAGNLACSAKVNIGENWALLDLSRHYYAS